MKPLRNWLLASIVFSLVACGKAAVVQDVTVFRDMSPLPLPDVSLVELPEKPTAHSLTVEGAGVVAFDQPNAAKLAAWATALTTNNDIAAESIKALKASDQQIAALIETGRLVERRANFLQGELATTKAELADEKLWSAISTWLHRVLILGIVAIGI